MSGSVNRMNFFEVGFVIASTLIIVMMWRSDLLFVWKLVLTAWVSVFVFLLALMEGRKVVID